MSDLLTHECGIAMVRLKKPLSYFREKYGTSLYGFQKLFLLMEKQHNRGQDGMGIGCCKLGMDHGKSYMFRTRSSERDSLSRLFSRANVPLPRVGAEGERSIPRTKARLKITSITEAKFLWATFVRNFRRLRNRCLPPLYSQN